MTPAEAIDVGGKLIHLLTQQRLLYRQLKELAQKQSSLVDGNDPETLLRVLASRQRLIDKLSSIDRELRPIRADWQEIAGALPPEQREQALELVDQVQAILGEILASDAKDGEVLQGHQQKVRRQIQGAMKGKQMNRAYAQSGVVNESRYLDGEG
ncbi:MAG: flagellar export chaperone FlgN [Planctomycetes bacterium]|nr:flagellar export chaperone FlgN [Planctomycetota bacterium]